MAMSLPDEVDRATALSGLAPWLPDERIEDLITIAYETEEHYSRSRLLLAAVARAGEDQLRRILPGILALRKLGNRLG